MYFSMNGLDEEAVQARVAHLFDPPERPEKSWTQMDVYSVVPETPVKAKDIANVVGLRYSQITARFQHLMKMRLIIRLDRGLFIRADCYDAWQEKELEVLEPEPTPVGPTQQSQSQLLEILRDGPKTARELLFAFDGEIGHDAIRQRLDRASACGLIEKEGSTWKIAA